MFVNGDYFYHVAVIFFGISQVHMAEWPHHMTFAVTICGVFLMELNWPNWNLATLTRPHICGGLITVGLAFV